MLVIALLFSSASFIFCFFPLVCGVYFLFHKSRKFQNVWLTLASLFFYAWGEPIFVLVMLASICANWMFGIGVQKYQANKRKKKILLVFSIVFNLSLLFVFKYLNFTLENLNAIPMVHLPQTHLILPIGISFFTFQAMSYVIDVYRGNGTAQRSIVNIALYISLFPQLIAGPIVRYETIADQIENRVESLDGFCNGLVRFVVGLSKKIIFANNLACVADAAFDGENLSVATAWLGAVAYTLQIYYDFSGYSDMAIGLGEIFGFRFLENFNYPYSSCSVSEFWRRWHISLGTWFRDYVYFPLGGSRVSSKVKLVRNLLIVWLLTGIWHGAQWTFVCWGLMYFILITVEKLSGFEKKKRKTTVFRYIYTMTFVVFGWVIFRSAGMGDAVNYFSAMFGGSSAALIDSTALRLLLSNYLFIIFGIVFSFPIVPWVKRKVGDRKKWLFVVKGTALVCLFIADLSYIVIGGYNPFIYFNF